MTGDDFFLLFAAFAGFVAAPTLLLWGVARLMRHNKAGGSDRGSRPNVGSMDELADKGRREATRSEKRTACRRDVRWPADWHPRGQKPDLRNATGDITA